MKAPETIPGAFAGGRLSLVVESHALKLMEVCRRICRGTLSLTGAQLLFMLDWTALYRQIGGSSP